MIFVLVLNIIELVKEIFFYSHTYKSIKCLLEIDILRYRNLFHFIRLYIGKPIL